MDGRSKRFSVTAVIVVVVVGGLRVAARTVFRPHEEAHQSAQSCGALRWRTTTVTRKSRFEPTPAVVREESIVELDGRALVTDVAHFACSLGPALGFRAAVVRRAEGQRADVSVFDASGSLVRVVHFEHEVESTSWSHEGEYFGALGPKGEVSVADILGTRDPVVLARGKVLLGGRIAWSHDGRSACFITGKAPAGGDDGDAELWCSTVPSAPVAIAKATWTGLGTLAPWVGFGLHGNKAHLCGDDLKPRDPECIGMTRPTTDG